MQVLMLNLFSNEYDEVKHLSCYVDLQYQEITHEKCMFNMENDKFDISVEV